MAINYKVYGKVVFERRLDAMREVGRSNAGCQTRRLPMGTNMDKARTARYQRRNKSWMHD